MLLLKWQQTGQTAKPVPSQVSLNKPLLLPNFLSKMLEYSDAGNDT